MSNTASSALGKMALSVFVEALETPEENVFNTMRFYEVNICSIIRSWLNTEQDEFNLIR